MDRFRKFLDHVADIEGWFQLGFLPILAALDDWQRSQGVVGDVAEIGVFAGRSFIPLAMCCQPGEQATAIDCWSDQGANETRSGWQDGTQRAAFDSHVRNCGVEPVTRVWEIDAALLPQLPHRALSGVRLFSVDGDHSSQATFRDLTFASAACLPKGLIIIDDVHNPDWPGVAEGLHAFMSHTLWRPLAIGHGKVVLCRSNRLATAMEAAREYISAVLPPRKTAIWRDVPVLIY